MTNFAELTTLRVGGPVAHLVRAQRREDIVGALAGVDAKATLVIGGGSNIVVSDAGWPGTTVAIQGGASGRRSVDGGAAIEFTVDAGVPWDEFVAATITAGCTGVELLSGIPGRVGAAPVQNIAAYGQQVCDVITSVGTFDHSTLTLGERTPAECGFTYRSSRFKTDWHGQVVITHVRFRLPVAAFTPPEPSTYGDIQRWFSSNAGDPTSIEARRTAVLAVRAAKSMVLDDTDPMTRSAGSFFMNPEVPAALADELIETFAFRGLPVQYLEGQRDHDPSSVTRRIPAALCLRAAGFNPGDQWGPVQLSNHHVLAIVTREGATADDVWQLSHLIRQRVAAEIGVHLQPEAQFIGEFDPVDVDTFVASHHFTPGATTQPKWLPSSTPPGA